MKFGETGRFDGEMFFPVGKADDFIADMVADPGEWYTSLALCSLNAFRKDRSAWEKAGAATDAFVWMLMKNR